MKRMEPIRSPNKVRELLQHVLDYGFKRDGILILFSLNTLLRISDVLDLKYEDIFDESGKAREYFDVVEKKSVSKDENSSLKGGKKTRRIKLPGDFAAELSRYASDLEMVKGDYFFYSIKKPHSHMTRKTAWRRMKKYGDAVGIDRLGCHGLRKTGGYQMYKKGVNIRVISEIYGHTTIAQTLQYISINQDMIDETMEKMNFSFHRILQKY